MRFQIDNGELLGKSTFFFCLHKNFALTLLCFHLQCTPRVLCLKGVRLPTWVDAYLTAISEIKGGAMAGAAISRAAGLVVYRIIQEVC